MGDESDAKKQAILKRTIDKKIEELKAVEVEHKESEISISNPRNQSVVRCNPLFPPPLTRGACKTCGFAFLPQSTKKNRRVRFAFIQGSETGWSATKVRVNANKRSTAGAGCS